MAKLTSAQKTAYREAVAFMDGTEHTCYYSAEQGIVLMAVYTGHYEQHFRIVASYCSENDIFKKKIGYTECVNKLNQGGGIVLPVKGASYLIYNVLDFISDNYGETVSWFQM